MTVGNRQGDPISPSAFILYLERLMDPVQEHNEAGVIISGSRINNLKFADDVDHRRAVAQHCINGDCLSQWGVPKFDPL